MTDNEPSLPGRKGASRDMVAAAYRPLRALIEHHALPESTEVTFTAPREAWIREGGRTTAIPDGDTAFATPGYFRELCRVLAADNRLPFVRSSGQSAATGGEEPHDGKPVLNCMTPDGHEFHALLGANAVTGLAVTIRLCGDGKSQAPT